MIVLLRVAVCRSVLRCVAVCCSVLQCVEVKRMWYLRTRIFPMIMALMISVARLWMIRLFFVYCSQCAAVCRCVLQCVFDTIVNN